jgi:hypothetical protein
MTFLGLIGPFQIILLLYLAFWIWALVDIIRSEFKGNAKVVWILVVLFTSIIGLILYLLIGRQQKQR